MGSHYARFVRSRLSTDEAREIDDVDRLADRLGAHIDASSPDLDLAQLVDTSSSKVEDVMAALLDVAGFRRQVVLTAQDGLVTRARPDFVYSLGPGRGIIAEVERGGTTTNNHDLKDFWKVHIASDAQHLFLMVPTTNWNRLGLPRERPFPRVVRRIGAFFGDPRREVDVLSAHVFGYGDSAPPSPSGRDPAGNPHPHP